MTKEVKTPASMTIPAGTMVAAPHKCTCGDKAPEVVRSIDGRVLAFGFTAIILVLMGICGALVFGMFSLSTHYAAELKSSQGKQQTILVLQRALDRADGKLSVYEEFISDRREEIVEKLIVKFLRKERVKSDNVTLHDFERWVGIGGK